MFAHALEMVTPFTQPVIISKRFFDGTIEAGCGTFVVVNQDGWILTAGHVFLDLALAKQHEKELAKYNAEVQKLESDSTLTAKQRAKRIGRLHKNPKWITNYSYWWAVDRRQAEQISVDEPADLALAKLKPFDPREISTYPVFKDPQSQFPVGTSLCRLGFPLHKINCTFDPKTGVFQLGPGVLPLPRFPLDGIHTRVAIGQVQNTNRRVKFIETSSAGLRGQSGGPIFDREGHVWAIQNQTAHFALGFNPRITVGNKQIEEHQFLNVGLGAHVSEIVSLLAEHKIAFTLSP